MFSFFRIKNNRVEDAEPTTYYFYEISVNGYGRWFVNGFENTSVTWDNFTLRQPLMMVGVPTLGFESLEAAEAFAHEDKERRIKSQRKIVKTI